MSVLQYWRKEGNVTLPSNNVVSSLFKVELFGFYYTIVVCFSLYMYIHVHYMIVHMSIFCQ